MAANVKIISDNKGFTAAMKENANALKQLKSEFGVANTQAKLFGTATDQLKNKQKELTSTLDIQNKTLKIQQDYNKKLTTDLNKLKGENVTLQQKIESTNKAYKESVTATGKNSEESKKLKQELTSLKDEFKKSENAISSTEKKLDSNNIKLNKTKEEIIKTKKALDDTNKSIDSFKSDQLIKKLDTVSGKFNSLGSTMTNKFTIPIAGLGAISFKNASDMGESMNKVETAFEDSADKVKAFGEISLDTYGMAKGTALDMTALFGDMSVGMGFTRDAAADMAIKVAGLAGDMSSYKNVSLDVAKTALAGIWTGETEALKGLGIVMTQTNLEAYALETGFLKADTSSTKYKDAVIKLDKAKSKLNDTIKKHGKNSKQAQEAQLGLEKAEENLVKASNKSINELSQEEQVKLRLAYVTDKTKDAQGDFSKTYESSSNQTKVFFESLKELTATIGEHLLPIITPMISRLTDIVKWFGTLDKGTQENIVKFGLFVAAIGPVMKVMGTVTGAVSKTIKTYDKLKDSIKKIPDIASKAGKGLKTFGGHVGTAAKAIGGFLKKSFLMIKDLVTMGAKAVWTGTKFVFLKLKTAALTVVTWLQTAAQAALNFVMSLNPITLIIIGIGLLIATIVILWNKCEWFRNLVMEFWRQLKESFTNFNEFLTGVFSTDWTESFGAFGEILNGFFQNCSNIWEDIKRIFGGIIDFVAGVFTGDWERAWDGICDIFGGIWDSLVDLAKWPLNSVISLVNAAIRGINSISVDIPDWVPGFGGSHIGFNLSTIGYLENGGILTEPTMLNANYMAGEKSMGRRSQAEAVIPLDAMYQNVQRRMELALQKSSQPIILNITNVTELQGREVGRVITQEVIKNIDNKQRSYNAGRGRFV